MEAPARTGGERKLASALAAGTWVSKASPRKHIWNSGNQEQDDSILEFLSSKFKSIQFHATGKGGSAGLRHRRRPLITSRNEFETHGESTTSGPARGHHRLRPRRREAHETARARHRHGRVRLEPGARQFLIKQGHHSVVCQLDLKGFDAELAVLAAHRSGLTRMEHAIAEYGADPARWLPSFLHSIDQH